MRRFGRQCRGMGKVFVTLVRQTERQLLEMGEPVLTLARAAQECLHGAPQLSDEQQARLDTQLTVALEAHHRIAHQSRRLTQGKALPHGKIVNAYDPTIAPICKGKSHCPAPFGRNPGIIAEPAAGFIFGLHLPVGNPGDTRSVEPLVDHVQQAIARVATFPRPAIRSLAGDLAFNDAALREVLHQQGILTVGIPKTVEPLPFVAHARGRPASSARGGLASSTDPVPGGSRVCVWIQPTRSGKHHGQPAVPWSCPRDLQRSSRCDRPNRDGRHGA